MLTLTEGRQAGNAVLYTQPTGLHVQERPLVCVAIEAPEFLDPVPDNSLVVLAFQCP